MTPPVALVTGGSILTTEIDTIGWDYLQVVMSLGVTDGIFTTLSITEADVSATSHTAVTGLVYDVSANIDGDTSSIPGISDSNNIFAFDIDLRGRKRFIDLTGTVDGTGSGAFASVIAILSRAEDTPVTMTQRGCNEVLRI
jgi:hypothetical protein